MECLRRAVRPVRPPERGRHRVVLGLSGAAQVTVGVLIAAAGITALVLVVDAVRRLVRHFGDVSR